MRHLRNTPAVGSIPAANSHLLPFLHRERFEVTLRGFGASSAFQRWIFRLASILFTSQWTSILRTFFSILLNQDNRSLPMLRKHHRVGSNWGLSHSASSPSFGHQRSFCHAEFILSHCQNRAFQWSEEHVIEVNQVTSRRKFHLALQHQLNVYWNR